MSRYQQQTPSVMPFTPMVKALVIINVSIWLIQYVIFGWILSGQVGSAIFTQNLSLIPRDVMLGFQVWRPLTYMFIHSDNLFHILFNMLTLWWVGSELEMRWGRKFFISYYLASGFGAGLIYAFGSGAAFLALGHFNSWGTTVVGASGAVFGLLIAYGILFGERVVSFMMLFPMKAKYFVGLLGLIELLNLMRDQDQGVANLAHLGGIVSGYLFLLGFTKFKQSKFGRGGGGGSGKKVSKSGLKLVVNNDKKWQDNPGDGPRYWN